MSRSMAEQLEALKLVSEPAAKPVEPTRPIKTKLQLKMARPNSRKINPPPDGKPSKLVSQLPMFGVVQRVEFDRGYGFISCQGPPKEVFFHFSRQQQKKDADKAGFQNGSPILFMLGSEEGKPDRRAVRWALAKDLNWGGSEPAHDQAALDAIRRSLLDQVSLAELWDLLHAGWYVQQRGTNTPPDLDDPVLEAVWFSRFAAMSPDELVAERVKQKLPKCRFRFLDMPNVNRLLGVFSNQQLAAIASPRQAWMNAVATLGAFWQPQNRQRLLEWHLLCNDGSIAPDWSRWFPAREPFEATVARFLIAQGLHGDGATRIWVHTLIDNDLLDQSDLVQWVGDSDAEAVAAFEKLSCQSQQKFWAMWVAKPSRLQAALDVTPTAAVTLLRTVTLAVDLETDGEEIWELGCARNGQKELLSATKQAGELADAMLQLAQRIQAAPLMVGHNLLAWDWPIISQHTRLAQPPLLWDTLLVQYLLEPQARTHALGSNHHADDDALAALRLFDSQATRMPASFVGDLLTGRYEDFPALLTEMGSLVDGCTYAAKMPDFLQPFCETTAVLVLPEDRLREAAWIPGITVVSANPEENLAIEWLQVDVAKLEAELQGELGEHPAALVLLAVARRALAQDIALRFGMVPPWLLDACQALDLALRRACVQPLAGNGLKLAPLPRDMAWLLARSPKEFQLVGIKGEVLVFDKQNRAALPLLEATRGQKASPLMRINTGVQQQQVWLQADRPALLLDKLAGWQSFCTVVLPKGFPGVQTVSLQGGVRTAPLRPLLATRRTMALYPNALDQAGYWTEVIRTFLELANALPAAVPILLVSSTGSTKLVELLANGLAEIQGRLVQPNYRSRLEHLRRAAKLKFALVDKVESWPHWQALAETAGVSLLPVVEALPIEQWFAAAQALLPESVGDAGDQIGVDAGDHASQMLEEDDGQDDAPDLDDGDTDVVASETTSATASQKSAVSPVKAGDLLQRLTELTSANLQNWMQETGLDKSSQPVRLMDARAAGLGRALQTCVDLVALQGEPLPQREIERLQGVFEEMQVERKPAPDDFATMERFLTQHWQPNPEERRPPLVGFKPSQKPAMEAICTRANDVLVALPTGEGKSVLFQVPALCRGINNRRLTLVLSPLKTLMRDQVNRLHKQGFFETVDYLNSDRPAHEIADMLQGVLDHRIVLLYVAPERLRSAVFVQVLHQRVESDGGLEYAVVDETHCVNQWGYQFRPDYFHALHLLLHEFREGSESQMTPMLMMSATVTDFDGKQLREMLTTATALGQPGLPFVKKPDGFVQPLQSHIHVQAVRAQGNINDRDAFEQVLDGRMPTIRKAIQAASDNHRDTGQRSAVLIFVTRRDHAEKLAQHLSNIGCKNVDFFHAGLDAATREEVQQRFSDGQVNVLVATKAFGMGMDIPDIHWAIHLGPPAFLEDYLQEVGRIGRGAAERAKAKLTQLQAILLFSADDFESLRNSRARSAVHLATVKKFYDSICANAQPVDNQWLALVPQDGFDPPSHPAARRMVATQLRLALYWLERAGCIHLQGLVPRLLPVTLNSAALERIAAGGGRLGLVAQVILGVEELPRQVTPATQPEGVLDAVGNWLGRALARLGDLVGYWLGGVPTGSAVPTTVRTVSSNQGPALGEAVVNVSQIMLRCGIESVGDAMACLVDLEQRGALTLKRNFQFAPRLLAQEQPDDIRKLFDAVDRAHDELTKRLGKQATHRFLPAELMLGWVPPSVSAGQSANFQAAFDWGVVCLSRVSGIRLKQVVEADQSVRWEARLATAQAPNVKTCSHQTLTIAQAVFKILRPRANGENSVVSLSELVNATRDALPGKRFRVSELKKALSLLSALRLVSLSAELLPMSYVLSLDSLHTDLSQHAKLWEELEDVNRMSELRNDAMEIFANLPSEAQSGFVEGYFAQTGSAGMESFLDKQVGEIDDQGNGELSQFIRAKREQLRATEVTQFLDVYKKSQEPNQWEAIKHPFDQHLLVNAGPGAGKTAVLVGRIVHLIREQGIQPTEIIVLAFNRAVVFEIRKRVRDLFRTLGYGAYVKRLRVYTFHALAMRSMALADVGHPQQDGLLSLFAKRLESDKPFRNQVAGGCRSILVDEYQDMTEDIYQIIRQLHFGSGQSAGVMAIGDDDQDILRWQRPNNEFSEVYFEKFEVDFGGSNLRKLSLKVNFRSGIDIVNQSQKMISEILEGNQHSRRIKDFQLHARQDPVMSNVHRIEWRYQDAPQSVGWRYWNAPQALEYVRQLCEQLGSADTASLAILCRTNAEVAQAHRELVRVLPDLAAQGAVNYRVANLRHVGLWLELLDQEAQRQNQALTDDLRQELLTKYRQQHVNIPEVRQPHPNHVQLDDLWRLCLAEQSFPHLSDLIRFIRELQLDELGRLLGAQTNSARRVVSTIHKVKGLEFDQVIVLPSDSRFSRAGAGLPNMAMDAAEEARLLYVAMTRAKQRLTYFVGEREYAWGVRTPRPFPGVQARGRILCGSHDEVWLSWAMIVINNHNPDPDACQLYIETQVCIGDVIRLGGNGGGAGMALWHLAATGARRQVGYLAAAVGPGNPHQADLRVSAVARFRPGDADGNLPINLAASVRAREWGYVVLVSGQLS